jgi:hypothetical protein
MSNRDEELRIMSLPGMQEEFAKRSKEWDEHDRVLCQDRQSENYVTTYENHVCMCNCEPRWFPLPIDLVNPERGLWGMVDWGRFVASVGNGGVVNIQEFPWGREMFFASATPTLALLKALAHQWGVEVKGERNEWKIL